MDLVFSRTKKIPSNRFGRECSLCSSNHGVPIECSARGCKVAYHTTCAIRGKLKMQAIFGKTFKGGIKLRSYCREHTPAENLGNGDNPAQGDKIDANGVKEIDMTNLADDRLQEDSEELDYFWKYVDINQVHKAISEAYARQRRLEKSGAALSAELLNLANPEAPPKKKLGRPKKIRPESDVPAPVASGSSSSKGKHAKQEVDPLAIDLIYRYWMLLRTANNGQSLIKFSPSALKEREFEQRKSIMKLRIELERVRNLSYMIGKREKLKSSWLKTHQNIIKRTFSLINDLKPVPDIQPSVDPSGPSNNSPTHADHHHHRIPNHQANNHHPNHAHMTNNKKSLHQTQHVLPTNGLFDESDQLINDLMTCDQIYDLPNSSTNSNYNSLSYQDRSTLERRRTLSLVRRINRQLKNVSMENPSLNPYKKSYFAPKRSDSPIATDHQPATKVVKYR